MATDVLHNILNDMLTELSDMNRCCVNKDSSVELTEAVNAMYGWYRWAKECYVFLPDVASVSEYECSNTENPVYESDEGAPFYTYQFQCSSWFTRGWTLQKLLVPRQMVFFNSSFQPIGSKSSLATILSETSGIATRYLNTHTVVATATIAERMGWAARRNTIRHEDMAYCLLGLLNVKMPVLYGEGPEKAFIRLQLEIIKKSPDESIFAWVGEKDYDTHWQRLLAPAPSSFTTPTDDSGNKLMTLRPSSNETLQYRHPYATTNKGLELTLDIQSTTVV